MGGFILTLQDNSLDKTIDLLVQSNTTALWTGAEDQKWNALVRPTTKNWKDLLSSPADYVAGLDVTFNDTATGFAPMIDGVVQPLSVVFNNSANTYTLGQANGAGDRISNRVVTSQTGTVDGSTKVITSIADTSVFTVGMTVTGAGIPAVRSSRRSPPTPSPSAMIPRCRARRSPLTGSTVPSLVKSGTGMLVINVGDNDFTGGATLNAGTIRFGASTTVTAGPSWEVRSAAASSRSMAALSRMTAMT